MKNRYAQQDLDALRAALGPSTPEPLVDRVYTSRLLGSDPSLVLYGGGNTSVKGTTRDLLGDEVRVLWVKGSGADLDGIGPAGFPACRLEPLLRMCEFPALSDDDMVKGLRSQMLDPGSPTPSVEALLHALLPAAFVDHTHADAVLSLVDRPDSARLVREVFGDRALYLPYVMPGFVLARAVAELLREASSRGPLPHVLVLDKHGIFTWGDSARESYDRMIAAVGEVEAYLARESVQPPAQIEAPAVAAEALLPRLRGALVRAFGRPTLLALDDGPEARAFTLRSDLATVSQIGCATPDHVIRTKPWPMLVSAHDDASLDASVEAFASRYAAYFDRCQAALVARGDTAPRTRLDPCPRVVLVPGLGIVGVGATHREARAAARVYAQTLAVISRASAASRYEPVSEVDLFELEHWSLEQAKLKKPSGKAPALAGKVAFITGAGSGIGLATAELFAAEGAHVVVTDRSEEALAAARQRLGKGPATFALCDVLSADSVSAAFASAVRAFGGVDLVVSNAGAAFQGDLSTDEGDQALTRSLELNLLSHQRVAREASRLLIAQRNGGALLFNASKSAFNQGPGFGPYAVPKAALVSLMRQYAVDLAPHGVRAGAVNADRIRTALFDGGLLESRARARGVTVDSYFKANLLSRETLASDVAEAFFYLATAQATTGGVITVDGGNAAAFVR